MENQENKGQEAPPPPPEPMDEVSEVVPGNGQSDQQQNQNSSGGTNQVAEVHDAVTNAGTSQQQPPTASNGRVIDGQNNGGSSVESSNVIPSVSVTEPKLRLVILSSSSSNSDEDIDMSIMSSSPKKRNLELIDYDDSDSDMDEELISPPQMNSSESLMSGTSQSADTAIDVGNKGAPLVKTKSLFSLTDVTNALDAAVESMAVTSKKLPFYLEKCKVCLNPADFVCQGCYRAAYCSEEHQKENWELHRPVCVHYGLIRSPSLLHRGSFSIDAAIDKTGKKLYILQSKGTAIEANQKILEEKPFLLCPWPRTKMRLFEGNLAGGVVIRNLSCFGCGKTLSFSWTRCETCNLFLCSAQCLHIANHRNAECKIIQEMTEQNPKKKQDSRLDLKTLHLIADYREYLYMDVMIIRLIFKFSEMRESMSPEEFAYEWGRLDLIWKSHQPTCGNERYNQIRDNMQNYLSFSYNLLKGDRNLLLKLFSIIDMNSFSFELPFRRFRALCVVLGLASHSCVPNCHAYLYEPEMEKIDINQIEENPNDMTVVLKTGCVLTDKTVLTFSYVPLIFGTEERRQILHATRLIWCVCSRCLDPTECGTFTTNMKCSTCQSAMILPSKHALAMGPEQEFQGLTKPNWECRGNNVITSRRPPMAGFRRPTASYGRPCPTVKHKDALDKIQTMETALVKYFLGSINAVKELLLTTRVNNNGHFFQSAILKLSEDLIRGTFFPLPDVLANDLSEYTDQALTAIVLAKSIYLEFMQKINPGFNFEGFPIANLELAENELLGRETGRRMYLECVNPFTQARLRGCIRSSATIII